MEFEYDAFLSHSSKDNERVDQLASLLMAAGIKIWFDNSVIASGDNIVNSIDDGLNKSKCLILCLSEAALESEWVKWERSVAIHRDPGNKQGRFIPVLIEDCDIPDSLNVFRIIDYRKPSDESLQELTDACKGSRPRKVNNPKQFTGKARAAYLNDIGESVEQLLHASLQQASFLELRILDSPEFVHTTSYYRNPERREDLGSLLSAFDKYRRRLLLLGAPGSGKTTAMLLLAQSLIESAVEDPRAPVPFLINLSEYPLDGRRLSDKYSSRAPSRRSSRSDQGMIQWLIEAFANKSGVSASVAAEWLHLGQIALLLDGLDEVSDLRRADFAKMLNRTLLKECHNAPILICSRTSEYLPIAKVDEACLKLKGAAELQVLNSDQIHEYLLSTEAKGLRGALDSDPKLMEMADTPLMLRILTLAYGGVEAESIPASGSMSERRYAVMEAYVDRMLLRTERKRRHLKTDVPEREIPERGYLYKPSSVRRFLGWIALRTSIRMKPACYPAKLYSFLTDWNVLQFPSDRLVTASVFGILNIAFCVASLYLLVPQQSILNGASLITIVVIPFAICVSRGLVRTIMRESSAERIDTALSVLLMLFVKFPLLSLSALYIFPGLRDRFTTEFSVFLCFALFLGFFFSWFITEYRRKILAASVIPLGTLLLASNPVWQSSWLVREYGAALTSVGIRIHGEYPLAMSAGVALSIWSISLVLMSNFAPVELEWTAMAPVASTIIVSLLVIILAIGLHLFPVLTPFSVCVLLSLTSTNNPQNRIREWTPWAASALLLCWVIDFHRIPMALFLIAPLIAGGYLLEMWAGKGDSASIIAKQAFMSEIGPDARPDIRMMIGAQYDELAAGKSGHEVMRDMLGMSSESQLHGERRGFEKIIALGPPRLLVRLVSSLSTVIDAVTDLLERLILSPACWLLLGTFGRLPMNGRRFRAYCTDSLLLKPSTGFEFVHRRVRDHFAVYQLYSQIHSANDQDRLKAIDALAFQGESAIESLGDFVREGSRELAAAATIALGRIASSETAIHIEAAASHEDPVVRKAALTSLIHVSDKKTSEILQKAVADPDVNVQAAGVMGSLDGLTYHDRDEFLIEFLDNHESRSDVVEALLSAGLLKFPDPTPKWVLTCCEKQLLRGGPVGEGALHALGGRNSELTDPELILPYATNTYSEETRVLALNILAKSAPRRAYPILLGAVLSAGSISLAAARTILNNKGFFSSQSDIDIVQAAELVDRIEMHRQYPKSYRLRLMGPSLEDRRALSRIRRRFKKNELSQSA